MWGCSEGLNPTFQSLCSKNEAAPNPPQNDEFSIKWHITYNLALKGNYTKFKVLHASHDF